jgi:hypothetical protein
LPFRLPIALLVLLVTLALSASQIPRWSFAYEADSCCCEHAGQCPCPGHKLPKHEKHDSVRSCGSGGHEIVTAAAPVCDLPPVAIADVAIGQRYEMPVPAAPHAAPDRDVPAAPS